LKNRLKQLLLLKKKKLNNLIKEEIRTPLAKFVLQEVFLLLTCLLFNILYKFVE